MAKPKPKSGEVRKTKYGSSPAAPQPTRARQAAADRYTAQAQKAAGGYEGTPASQRAAKRRAALAKAKGTGIASIRNSNGTTSKQLPQRKKPSSRFSATKKK